MGWAHNSSLGRVFGFFFCCLSFLHFSSSHYDNIFKCVSPMAYQIEVIWAGKNMFWLCYWFYLLIIYLYSIYKYTIYKYITLSYTYIEFKCVSPMAYQIEVIWAGKNMFWLCYWFYLLIIYLYSIYKYTIYKYITLSYTYIETLWLR